MMHMYSTYETIGTKTKTLSELTLTVTIPFSGLGRTFTGGCYDPIVRAPTLHAPCMADRHCEHMPHTRCSQSALDTLKVPYLNDVYEIITFTITQVA